MSAQDKKLAALGLRVMPDPTWKERQAFIRATRRGSKKRTSMEEKLKLLDAATAAIPVPTKVPDAKRLARDLARNRVADRQLNAELQRRRAADALKRAAAGPAADVCGPVAKP